MAYYSVPIDEYDAIISANLRLESENSHLKAENKKLKKELQKAVKSPLIKAKKHLDFSECAGWPKKTVTYLRKLPNQKTEDSSFILAIMRMLYQNEYNRLSKISACGRGGNAMVSPQKKTLMSVFSALEHITYDH